MDAIARVRRQVWRRRVAAESERAAVDGHRWRVLGAISVGMFLSIAVSAGPNVALPALAADLDMPLTVVQWIAVGVPLTTAVLLLPAGFAADVGGRRRVYLIGMTLCSAGTLLAGFAPSTFVLVLARLLQGASMAAVGVNGIAILVSVFPPAERGRALGFASATVGLSAVAAPAAAGVLVDYIGWRWVFLTMAITAVSGTLLAWAVLDETRMRGTEERQSGTRFDIVGALAIAVGVVSIVIALTMGPDHGWASPAVLWPGILGAACLGFFGWWEQRVANPLFDVRLLKRRALTLGMTGRAFTLVGVAGANFLLPFFVQGVQGHSATAFALMMAPGFVIYAITASQAGRLSDRLGVRKFLVFGPVAAGLTIVALAGLPIDAPLAAIALVLALQNLGMGAYWAPTTSAIMGAVRASNYGATLAFATLVNHVAIVAGIALSTAVVASIMHSQGSDPLLGTRADPAMAAGAAEAFMTGARIAFLTLSGAAVLGIVAAIAFRSATPQDT